MNREQLSRRRAMMAAQIKTPIHSWDARNYDPTTYTIPDTGSASDADVKFDFTSTSGMVAGMSFAEDYIEFPGGTSNYFLMTPTSTPLLNWGRSVRLELDFELLEVNANSNGNDKAFIVDFASVASTAELSSTRGITISESFIGGMNLKFNGNAWWGANANNFTQTLSYDVGVGVRRIYSDTWINDGSTIQFSNYLDGEPLITSSTTSDVDLSWDRFPYARTGNTYIGRSYNSNYTNSARWRFYSLKIYNLD